MPAHPDLANHRHETPAPDSALVSVIVRSMDRPSLGAALDSVVLQTHRPIELVIVNALGQAHRPIPPRCGGVPVLAVAAPGGRPLMRAQAANRGLDAASGPFVLFLDDDDLLLADHLSRLAATLQAQPDAPAAYADVAQGRFEAGHWQPLHCFDAGFDPVRLLFENYLPIHGVLFRKILPGSRPRFDESFDLFEDWDFWLQVAAHGAFVHVPGVSARYVVSGIQQSDVFSESATAQATRARLFEKWRHHATPELHAAALQRLQRLYRDASQAQAQVQLLRTGEAELKDIVAARDDDLSSAARTVDGLRAIVAAREQDLANAAARVADLQRVIAEREREVADAAAHAGALQQIIAEREREVASAAAQAVDLLAVIKAREREVADAAAHAVDLQAVIAERDREVANAAAHAADLQRVINERDREVANALAHATGLEQVLARRQEEIDNAIAEVGALRGILAARDREIVERARALDAQALALARKDSRIATLQDDLSRGLAELTERQAELDARQAELTALHAEGPLQALKRTLQGKPHGSR